MRVVPEARQVEGHGCAATLGLTCIGLSAVRISDLPHDRQTKTGSWHRPGRLDAVEPFEHLLPLSYGNARPLIDDRDTAAIDLDPDRGASRRELRRNIEE